MQEEMELRREIVDACRRLAASGLIAATDGNVSCRLGAGGLLITPSGIAKAELLPADLLLTDLEGKVVAGSGKPSSEIRMHLLVYAKRPDVRAVVHAHPPLLTAFTLASLPFSSETLPEVWLTIGPVPTAPYATPSTGEVPDSIAPYIEEHHAILLERHGALTVGETLGQARSRLEKLEHAAHTLYFAHMLAGAAPPPLTGRELAKLSALRKS
jgi:L-fuculose-phosphate aldolase